MNPALIAAVTTAFESSFGAAPTHFVQAPGRVNLIGEHTDYNDGFVLPCAINHGTVIAAAPRNDGLVRVVAADYGNAVDQFRLDTPIVPHATELWPNYVRGVVKYLQEHGLALQGADLALSGDVPQGAGLSSSASLEVAVTQAFKSLQGWTDVQPTDMALIAQRAENRFVGCNCGIMDQLISARGQEGHALLIDCRSLDARAVPMPPGVAVMIVNSRVQRGLVESAYNIRRQQCEAAAAHFSVPALRDATPEMLDAYSVGIDPVVLRRARHIVTENQRTLDACEALSRGDMQRMGVLMAESHASMRDDFEITVPAIDQLVQLLQDAIGAHGGARMTGGGFGGCVVALLPEAMVAEVRAVVDTHYRSPNGLPGDVYVCLPSAGAGAIA